MLVVYLIKLSSTLMAGRFEELVRTRYLSAIHAGPAGVERVKSVRVLRCTRMTQDDPLDENRKFLMFIEYDGAHRGLPRIDDIAVAKLFESFEKEVTALGGFDEVASQLYANN